jgi:transcriptional regulator with XRE-family HTH domain
MYPTIFWGDLFRSLRTSRALLQKELATILHTSRQSYSNLETGRAHPRPEQLAVLSYVFDINLTEYIYKSLPTELQTELRRFRSEQRRRMQTEKAGKQAKKGQAEAEAGSGDGTLQTLPPKKRSRKTPTLIRPNTDQDALDFLLSEPHEIVADPGAPYGTPEETKGL